jgi:hypothetical protein
MTGVYKVLPRGNTRYSAFFYNFGLILNNSARNQIYNYMDENRTGYTLMGLRISVEATTGIYHINFVSAVTKIRELHFV